MSEPGLFLCLVLLLLVTEIFKVEAKCLTKVAQKRCTMAGLHSLWDLLLLFCAQWNEALGQARKKWGGIRRWNLPSSNSLSKKKLPFEAADSLLGRQYVVIFLSPKSLLDGWWGLLSWACSDQARQTGFLLRHASNISLGNSAFVNWSNEWCVQIEATTIPRSGRGFQRSGSALDLAWDGWK